MRLGERRRPDRATGCVVPTPWPSGEATPWRQHEGRWLPPARGKEGTSVWHAEDARA